MAKRKNNLAMIAQLNANMCTGCRSCETICPTKCISTVAGVRPDFAPTVCHVDTDRCVGCKLCDQVCPWDCIEMVPAKRELATVG